MASVKFQLEELKKPNLRCVLEPHTFRGMIQEADSIDKFNGCPPQDVSRIMPLDAVPFTPQDPPQLPSMGVLQPLLSFISPPTPQR
jgi:hypothetical protein